MNEKPHPLTEHLRKTGETLTSFAARVNLSRTHLYRILHGDDTRTSTLRTISEATDGKVSVSDMLRETAQ